MEKQLYWIVMTATHKSPYTSQSDVQADGRHTFGLRLGKGMDVQLSYLFFSWFPSSEIKNLKLSEWGGRLFFRF